MHAAAVGDDRAGRAGILADAENRLVQVITRRSGNPQLGDAKVEYVYDYMGRRVRKTASWYNGSAWSEDGDLLFVYDGWNVILVLDANASNATKSKYTWGLDLSGLFGVASRCIGTSAVVAGIDAGTRRGRCKVRSHPRRIASGVLK